MTHKDAVDTTAVERYLLGEMSDTDRLMFEEHYFSCAECAEELRSAASMLEGARSGLAETSRGNVRAFDSAAAKRQTMARYRLAALPWAVAATLAVAVGVPIAPALGRPMRRAYCAVPGNAQAPEPRRRADCSTRSGCRSCDIGS